MKPAMLLLLLASTHALRAPPRLRIARPLLRSEPEEATPEIDTTAAPSERVEIGALRARGARVVSSADLFSRFTEARTPPIQSLRISVLL